jgi:hypothetical protein
MYTKEALISIDNDLRRRGLRGQLIRKLRVDRPKLTWDTLARAFSEPETQTPLLEWIREEAEVMVKRAEMDAVLDSA